MWEYTKAKMLLYIKKNMTKVNILPILIIDSDEFFSKTNQIIEKIIKFSQNKPIIVRSSSVQEDNEKYSNAGKFESILNVQPNYEAIKVAVNKVYNSYETSDNEQILIQPMLDNIKKTGVVFTKDIDTGADYYIVNYQEGNDSAAVTSGKTNELKTFIKYKFKEFSIEDKELGELLKICNDIEVFLNCNALDIEFAITNDGTIYILQVRRIVEGNKETKRSNKLATPINKIYKKIKKLSAKHPFLLGDTTYFGVMPDWNPAEILGVRPKKLSISLYKELVTDNIWANQRLNYGYRDLTMHPLMVLFCGIPYIDTRVTFNSFVPKSLDDEIAEKLINYYLNKLAKYPKYHDKVEFEIVYSCYYIGITKKLKELLKYGFGEKEVLKIENSLLDLTNKIIHPKTGLYKKDIEKIKILQENYLKIIKSENSAIDKIYWLIEQCKRYGTLPFAGVARAAFIAIQFLKSFVDIGIISKEEYDLYMKSLNTISKKMNMDLKKHYQGKISKNDFLNMYGHVRPGTYDIMSERYDEGYDRYFGSISDLGLEREEYTFSVVQMNLIEEKLKENRLLVTAVELMQFIKEAIEGREYLKFIFTKAVSKILQLVEQIGNRVGIGKEDMAYLDITMVKQLYSDLCAGDIKDIFEENIRNNKIQYEKAVQIKLPSIIIKPEDVYSFYLLEEEPNYITQKEVTADVAFVDDHNIEGKIVFIKAADPGYDFLFSKHIGGLVTQFGGANSHMAIRCAELGIPAIIGAGEEKYKEWSKYKRMTIDCMKRQIIRIS